MRIIKILTVLFPIVLSLLLSQNAYAAFGSYAQKLCSSDANMSCFLVGKGDSWASLWPDPAQRQVAMRINRMNSHLYPGQQLLDPDDMSDSDIGALMPFPKDIGNPGVRTILVSLRHLAWAAYDVDGSLVRWGPASGGRGFCVDINGSCVTPNGTFTIYNKAGESCISSKYPVPDGGAPMPYCMYFKGGFALHGSNEVPGYNASHGCVRMFTSDVQWLNREFITVGETKVIVRDDA